MNFQLNFGLYYSMYESVGKGPFWLWVVFLLASIVAAYLLGSINSAIIISKLFYGDDIRKHGSGNAGTTNMLRTYGAKAALFTLIFDMLKTVLAIGFAGFLLGFYYVPGAISISEVCYIAGLFAVIGHVFPVYYQGKGGKGVLCAATMALVLAPIVFAILLAVFAALVAMTRYVSLGSVVGVGLFPVAIRGFMAVLYPESHLSGLISLSAIILAVLIIWCHRENLKRIMNREEHQISFKKKVKEPVTEEDEKQEK